jgi:DNA-binding NtrC family response regulator
MTATAPRLLLVDDDEAACTLLAEVLERESYSVIRALSASEAIQRVERDGPFDAVLTDLRMPGSSGLDLLREIRSRDANAIVFVLTAFGDAAAAGEAIRAGAHDFISKPYDLGELRVTIGRALARGKLATSARGAPAPKTGAKERAIEPTLVGHSPAIIEVMKTVARVAPSQASVLIFGETGAGKELVARAIHR